MPVFSSAPVQDVAPQRRSRQPSQRARLQQQYQDALRNAIIERQEALVVQLEPDDKPLTVRNRLKRAASAVGLEDVVIRRRKDRIIAYDPSREGA